MACLANTTYDFEAIKAESNGNDFRPADEDADDGIDLDQVKAAESRMKNALAEFQIANEGQAGAENWESDVAESHLKDVEREAAKAQEMLKEVEAELNDCEDDMVKDQEDWMTAAALPDTGISLTDALVGKSLFDKKDEDEEENIQNDKIDAEERKKKEEESVWEKCMDKGEETKTKDCKEANEAEEPCFDWAKQRSERKLGKKKSQRSMRRISEGTADEGKTNKTRKSIPRRSKSMSSQKSTESQEE